MSVRARYWTAGLASALVAALVAGGDPDARGYRVLGIVLALGVLGLIGEWIASARAAIRAREARDALDPRPADGVVELARVRGIRAEPNPLDPAFRRFVAIDPEGDEPDGSGRGDSFPPPASPIHDWGRRRSPPLLGRVVVFSMFQGCDGETWTEDELAEAHAALRRAGAWIEREAKRWHVPVNVELADAYFVWLDDEPDTVELAYVPEGEQYGPMEARAATKAVVAMSRGAAALGFRDVVDLFAEVNPRVLADARVWLLHPRRRGRSLAIPPELTPMDGVSLAVCYARESSFPEPLGYRPPYTDPVTIVHELLHLFGASDKYGRSARAFAPRSVTSRDVMLLHEHTLNRLRVDPGTAAEIGWTDDPAGAGP